MIKKILITGAGGMLGSDLLQELSSSFEVFGIGRSEAPHLHDYSYKVLDLQNDDLLYSYLIDLKPDLIIHAAAFTKVDACESEKENAYSGNFLTTQQLIEFSNDLEIPIIFFSTDYVFNGEKPGEYLESDITAPINYYGYTKKCAEEELMDHCQKYIIFRVTWLFGEHGNHFIKAILKQLPMRNELKVVSDQLGRPTYTSDIAELMKKLLLEHPNLMEDFNQNTYHIGNSGTTHWADYARHILKEVGREDVAVINVTSAEFPTPAKRPKNSVLSLQKFKNDFGFEMPSWENAVIRFLEKINQSQ